MTAIVPEMQPISTIDRALQSLRVRRPVDDVAERETIIAQPGYFSALAANEARNGRRYSD